MMALVSVATEAGPKRDAVTLAARPFPDHWKRWKLEQLMFSLFALHDAICVALF